jgi:hypothetical protein
MMAIDSCFVNRAPDAYFKDKPIGRLLSRFSQDLFVIGEQAPFFLADFC